MIRAALFAPALLATALIAAAPAPAPGPSSENQAHFAALLKGRVAGRPVACILPEFAVQPEILDGQAIAYRAAGTLYVNRFAGAGCPSIRQRSLIRTESIAGRLCRNDHLRVSEPGTPSGELCAFGAFTPYTRAPDQSR